MHWGPPGTTQMLIACSSRCGQGRIHRYAGPTRYTLRPRLYWRRRDPWRGWSRVDAAPSPLAVPCPKASAPDAAYYLRCPVGAAAHRPSHQWPCELPPEPPRRRLWKPLQWRASREHDAEEPRGSSAVLPLDAVTLPLYPTLVHTAALTCPSAPSSAISVTRDRA